MKKKKSFLALLFFICLVLLWFLAFDISGFDIVCHDCDFQKEVIQYRLFTFPLYQRTTFVFHGFKERLAEDLGVPCLHKDICRYHLRRKWGGFFRKIYRFPVSSFGHSYDSIDPNTIRELLAENPNLPTEFEQRVLIKHDREYFFDLTDKLFKRGMYNQDNSKDQMKEDIREK